MIEGKNHEPDPPGPVAWDPNMPDLVSPLELAGGLLAPSLSDEELDEQCVIQIADLSRPRPSRLR